jgi:hypothetical protein
LLQQVTGKPILHFGTFSSKVLTGRVESFGEIFAISALKEQVRAMLALRSYSIPTAGIALGWKRPSLNQQAQCT